MSGDTITKIRYWRQAKRYTALGIDGKVYETQRWELIASDTIYENGPDGSRYDIQWWEMKEGDTKYRDVNWWQAIRYNDLRTSCRLNDIRSWELMAGDTI